MGYVEIGIFFILVVLLWGIGYVGRQTITVKNKAETGMNFGSMIYTDEKGGQLLKDEVLGLKGKPDYIFKTYFTGKYIPFEIKSGKCMEDEPHPGDLMQLTTYFLLIESYYNKRPPYGKLVYANKTFKIRNTRRLRKRLLSIVEEMRWMLEGNYRQEAEPSYIKCKNCICRDTVCEWYETER